jgi:excinuclease UvrABC ATPase subunit
LLFAKLAEAHCPRTNEVVPSRSANQILEAILSLPEGAEIELRAPVFKVYGEALDYVFTELRNPEGGHAGGKVVVTGTPEAVAARQRSHRGRFLRAHL